MTTPEKTSRDESGRPSRIDEGAARRAYARPTLIEYGSVAKLTRGTLTKQADGAGAGFRMANCL